MSTQTKRKGAVTASAMNATSSKGEQPISKTPLPTKSSAVEKSPKVTKGDEAKKKRAIAETSKGHEKNVKKVKKDSKPTNDEPESKTVSQKPASKKRSQATMEEKKAFVDTSIHPGRDQIKLACVALLQHVSAYEKAKKQKALSLPGVAKEGQTIFVQIGLRNMPEQALKTFKGRPIPLPHPFRDMSGSTVCMFVKDKAEAKKWLGDDYEKHGIKKIISLQQLRTDYKAFSDKRELADLYDVFVADDRIVTMLPKALGKAFYVGPKRPLPIRLAQRDKLSGDVTKKITKALQSAYFYLSGVSTSIRIGSSLQPAEDIIENVEKVISGAVDFIPGKWKGVQSIFIKSEKSAALPIYEAPIEFKDEA